MNKYNYSLTYKDNLRWRDFRAENQHFTASTPVKLDIVTYTDNSQTMLHIHNYNTRGASETDKNVKLTLSCIAGVGRIRFEIFGCMKFDNPTINPDNFLTSDPGLWICYRKTTRICYLVSPFDMFAGTRYTPELEGLWHFIPLVEIPTRYLFLAIPLTIVSVK